MDRTANPPRIVIYGLGQYGMMITRLAADRGDRGWPIVAPFDRAGIKASTRWRTQAWKKP